MTETPGKGLTIEPVVSYPRTARPGQRYYLTVDVRHQHPPEQWLVEQEEFALTCLLETALFWHEPLGDQKIVLHRFGGSYGPAAFLLTAREKLQKGSITLSLVNRYGLTVHTILLDDIELVDTPAAPTPQTITVPVARPPEPPPQQEVRQEAQKAIPSPSKLPWISFSKAVDVNLARRIKAALEPVRHDLVTLGLVEERTPPVHVELHTEGGEPITYDAERHQIRLREQLATAKDLLSREYARHALTTILDDKKHVSLDLETALAEYLVCSFKNASIFGREEARLLKTGKAHLHNLRNKRRFALNGLLAEADAPLSEVEVETWGGAFWALREAFTADFLDSLLAHSWVMHDSNFIRRLLSELVHYSLEGLELACEILHERGVITQQTQQDLLLEAMKAQSRAAPQPVLERPEVEQILSLLTGPYAHRNICLEGYYGQGGHTVMKQVGERLSRMKPPGYFILMDAVADPTYGFSRKSHLSSLDSRLSLIRKDVSGLDSKGLAVVGIGNFHLYTQSLRARSDKALREELSAKLFWRLIDFDIRCILETRPGTPVPPEAMVIRLRDLDTWQMQQLAKLHDIGLSEEAARELVEWTGGSIRLATVALRGVRKQGLYLEDLMRFEGEDWSRIFDNEVAVARGWVTSDALLEAVLQEVIRKGNTSLDKRVALPLEGMGLIRKLADGTYTLRSPFYTRIFLPDYASRLPKAFRDRAAPRQWSFHSSIAPRGGVLEIELILESSEPRKHPIPEPVRFRLTPEREQTVMPHGGRASARFTVPGVFGPITAYAEIADGRQQLSQQFNRIDANSAHPPLEPPETPRPRKDDRPTKGTAKKAVEKVIEKAVKKVAKEVLSLKERKPPHRR